MNQSFEEIPDLSAVVVPATPNTRLVILLDISIRRKARRPIYKKVVKLVEAEIEKWAEELFLAASKCWVPIGCFHERTKLAVEVVNKNIKDMDDLRRVLGQWCFVDQYGSTLFTMHLEKINFVK
jgi:hypothetical protein